MCRAYPPSSYLCILYVLCELDSALVRVFLWSQRLTIGGSDEEADDEKVDEREFADIYRQLVVQARKR